MKRILEGGKPVAFVATTNGAKAREFYEGLLGLHVLEDQPYALVLESSGTTIRVQKVETSRAAPYTALGWEVHDVGEIVAALRASGVAFERYPGMDQDDHGIWTAPGGSRVAWFKDPDGNLLSVSGA